MPPEVVARVDDEPVTVDDLAVRLTVVRSRAPDGSLPAPGSPEDRRLQRWVVQTLVDELLLEREGRRRGFPSRRHPGEPIDDAVVVAVFEALVAHVRVDDRDVARYYAANLHRYRHPPSRTIRQVVVDDADTAAKLVTSARAIGLTRASDELARDRRPHRLERAVLRRGAVGPPLEPAVLDAEVGAVVGPLRTDAGWHVVQVDAASGERVTPLASVARDIRDDLLAAARGDAFDRWVARSRRDRVRLMPGYEHPGDPSVPDAVHRH